MATRPSKAAKTPKAKAAAPAPKKAPKKAAKPKGGARGAKPAKDGNGGRGRRGQPPMLYEDAQPEGGEGVSFEEERPGFMERWRLRRAERAQAKAMERERREKEREAGRERRAQEEAEAAERQRRLDEEQRLQREERERQERERLEAEEKARRAEEAAGERKAKAAARREEARRGKEAEEARKAEEAIREAAEEADKAREADEAKARRAAEREAKRQALEEEERRKAEEQARRDAEEEAEREAGRRRLAVQEQMREEREAEEAAKARAAPKELEPEMEFQEASKPVSPGREVVPKDKAAGGTAADVQADLMVAELARRRSKPILVDEPLPEIPKIPKAPLRPGEEWRDAPGSAPKADAAFAEAPAAPPPSEAFGFALPEAFLLLGADGQWDERLEKNKGGAYGGALAGAILLELLLARAIMVQRDRFVPTGEAPDDPALAAALERLRRIRDKKGDVASLRQMAELAKANRELLVPFKDSLRSRGLAEHGSRRHLGLFHRSWLQVTDVDAQERLQNRLRRAIAGGGTPEPHSVLLLGLLDATGQFGTVVPDEAADYNRKRLNGLLGGRDIMGYKVHPDLKALQEVAVRTILANVRIMTTRG